jgi:hypothetical protein
VKLGGRVRFGIESVDQFAGRQLPYAHDVVIEIRREKPRVSRKDRGEIYTTGWRSHENTGGKRNVALLTNGLREECGQ